MKISEMSNTSLRVLTGGLMTAVIIIAFMLETRFPHLHIVRWLSVLIACGCIAEAVNCMIKAGTENLRKNIWLYAGFSMLLLLGLISAYGVGSHPGIMLWMLLIIIGADIGAWFIGNIFGGDKMWPRISEHKTWSGQIGGIICGTLMSLAYFKIFGGFLANAIWVGISVSLLSQYGDLTASTIKRNLGIKDFGNLLPGHGGILDRFDGWLYVLPLIWFIIH